jgi:hypothetical protein
MCKVLLVAGAYFLCFHTLRAEEVLVVILQLDAPRAEKILVVILHSVSIHLGLKKYWS